MQKDKPAAIDVVIDAILNNEITATTPLSDIRPKIAGCFDRILYYGETDLRQLVHNAFTHAEGEALHRVVKALTVLVHPSNLPHLQKGLELIHPDIVQDIANMCNRALSEEGQRLHHIMIQSLMTD